MSEPIRGTRRNAPEPPATIELFWCSYCGGSALEVDELFHLSKRCPGKSDISVVMKVTLRTDAVEPCG